MLILVHWLMLLPLCLDFCVGSLLCDAVLSVLSSLAIILLGKELSCKPNIYMS